jgi:outer membrane immunogenic protein
MPHAGRMVDSACLGAVMKKLATCVIAVAGMIGTPAFAADMAVKAPPPAPAPAPTWTGFYGGIQLGGGWSDGAVNYSPNDPASAKIFNGTNPFPGNQPLATSYQIKQSGLVGGFEAGYNWQVGSNWLLGLEADFSFSSMSSRQASSTSNFDNAPPITQTSNANQSTDWYGTVRGRAGWIAIPNLLLFGTGGLAYGRVADSANYLLNSSAPGGVVSAIIFSPPFGAICLLNGTTCFAGSSSGIRTGWTAGGGAEWLFNQHWSAKIEYQFVDLGTEATRVTAGSIGVPAVLGVRTPASFNAAFPDRFNVVRLGLNYHF